MLFFPDDVSKHKENLEKDSFIAVPQICVTMFKLESQSILYFYGQYARMPKIKRCIPLSQIPVYELGATEIK